MFSKNITMSDVTKKQSRENIQSPRASLPSGAGFPARLLREVRPHYQFLMTRGAWMSLKAVCPLLFLGFIAINATGQNDREKTLGPNKDTERVEAVMVELDDYGFYPKTIERKPGKFYLVVRNVSRQKNAVLRMNLENASTALKKTSLDTNKSRAIDLYDLQPGTYILSAENAKTQSIKITIK